MLTSCFQVLHLHTQITPVLVTTDVTARGVDVPDVAHVINFDVPRAEVDYVLR